MKRNTLNFVVDTASALVALGLVGTGLLMRFVLPPGSGSRLLLWSLGRHDWGDVHFWLAVSAAALLVVHLALHWQWVCSTALRLCRMPAVNENHTGVGRRNLAGIGLIVVLVAALWGFVGMSRSMIYEERGSGAGEGRGLGRQVAADPDHDEFIRGSMTLAEAATAGDVPVQVLRAELRLPDHVSGDQRLGRMSREHGFSINQVRDILASHRTRPTTRAD